MEYLVTLSTIPVRFDDSIYLTIDSFLEQSFKASRIVVNIPKKYSYRIALCKLDRGDCRHRSEVRLKQRSFFGQKKEELERIVN